MAQKKTTISHQKMPTRTISPAQFMPRKAENNFSSILLFDELKRDCLRKTPVLARVEVVFL
jgi:hypothetical protein